MKLCDRAAPWLAVLLSLLSYAWRMAHHVARPTDTFRGWWGWFDQGMYLRATQAWAAGQLDPALHWYFPGYPLLAAPFLAVTPIDPFIVPDVLCLGLAGLSFVALCARLVPRPGVPTLAAIVWTVTITASPLGMRMWVEPWTTTPAAVLTYASLWLLLRQIDRPSARDAAGLGLAAGAVLLFRPTDAAVLLVITGLVAGLVVLRRRDWRSAVAGLGGVAVAILVFAGLYTALYGLTQSQYLAGSGTIGFEWRLLPLRWVTLVVDPRGLVPNEDSLTQAFWYVLPGIAGCAATLATARGTALARHAAILAAVTAHLVVYLIYRDLHPQGLLRYGNYHYFKWLLPVLGFYAVLLVAAPIWYGYRRRGWAAAAVAAGALFCWRAEFVPDGRTGIVANPHTLMLPDGIGPLNGAVRVTAKEAFSETYLGDYGMEAGGVRWASNAAIKAQPVPYGFLFIGLRALPPGAARVDFPPDVFLTADPPPAMGRQAIVFSPPFNGGWLARAAGRFERWRARP